MTPSNLARKSESRPTFAVHGLFHPSLGEEAALAVGEHEDVGVVPGRGAAAGQREHRHVEHAGVPGLGGERWGERHEGGRRRGGTLWCASKISGVIGWPGLGEPRARYRLADAIPWPGINPDPAVACRVRSGDGRSGSNAGEREGIPCETRHLLAGEVAGAVMTAEVLRCRRSSGGRSRRGHRLPSPSLRCHTRTRRQLTLEPSGHRREMVQGP